MSEYFLFRGVDNLVYAEVTKDTLEEFVTGEVKALSPVAEIGKTTETSSEAKYYDNIPMFIDKSEGPDEISCRVVPLTLDVLADITGKFFDEETGMMIDGPSTNKYFAIGYRTKGNDGLYRYVWRLKGTFNIPDETSATEDDGTESNDQELIFTGIHTVHKFTKTNATAKGLIVDERIGSADVETFFETVQTPDTVKAKTV